MSRILITGGAGFIGTHLARALLEQGHEVRILDAFVSQVHPDHIASHARCMAMGASLNVGPLGLANNARIALEGVDVVYHLAAEVGVGQSMYEIERYVNANTRGTAVLLEAMKDRHGQIKKLIVASSMSIYGEGPCYCPICATNYITRMPHRPKDMLEKRRWDFVCGDHGIELLPVGVREHDELAPASVYAITKQDQEQLCLTVGRAYGIPTVALRYFNVYGPGQALSNPYTGVMAIFAGRLLNGQPPLVFEDGGQTRDFVHVSDIVQANLLALASSEADGRAINVGTGFGTSILGVAELLAQGLGLDIKPEVTGLYRAGDIRHCIADISRAREFLGYEPKVSLEEGIPGFLEWVRSQTAVDRVEAATDELRARGLVQ